MRENLTIVYHLMMEVKIEKFCTKYGVGGSIVEDEHNKLMNQENVDNVEKETISKEAEKA